VASSVPGTLVRFHINGRTGPCVVRAQTGIFAAALARDQIARCAAATAVPAQNR
jgi:hypothetical protein